MRTYSEYVYNVTSEFIYGYRVSTGNTYTGKVYDAVTSLHAHHIIRTTRNAV